MATTRSRKDFSNYFPSSYTQYTKYGDNAAVSRVVPSNSYSGSAKYVDDVPHPQFKRLIRNGAIVLDDCAIRTESREFTDGSIALIDPPNMVDIVEGDIIGVVAGLITSRACATSATAERVCLLKAYAKMNESAMLVGEIVNDLNKTLLMLKKPLVSIRKLVKKVHKSKMAWTRRKQLSDAQASANAWLEYRYGWKPLILDIQTIIDHFQKQVRKYGGETLVARSGVTFSDERRGTIGPPILPLGRSTIVGSYSTADKASYMGGVLYTKSVFQDPDGIDALLGTRARDVAPTLWEMLPLSFVLDWFINVGDWLQALIPVPGVNPIGNFATLTRVTTEFVAGRFEFSGTDEQARGTYHGSFGTSETKVRSHTRRVRIDLSSYPVLKLQILSRLHQADAAMLLLQPILGELKKLKH